MTQAPTLERHREAFGLVQDLISTGAAELWERGQSTLDSSHLAELDQELARLLLYEQKLAEFRSKPHHRLADEISLLKMTQNPQLQEAIRELRNIDRGVFGELQPQQLADVWFRAAFKRPGNRAVTEYEAERACMNALEEIAKEAGLESQLLRQYSGTFFWFTHPMQSVPFTGFGGDPDNIPLPGWKYGAELPGWNNTELDLEAGYQAAHRLVLMKRPGFRVVPSGKYPG